MRVLSSLSFCLPAAFIRFIFSLPARRVRSIAPIHFFHSRSLTLSPSARSFFDCCRSFPPFLASSISVYASCNKFILHLGATQHRNAGETTSILSVESFRGSARQQCAEYHQTLLSSLSRSVYFYEILYRNKYTQMFDIFLGYKS